MSKKSREVEEFNSRIFAYFVISMLIFVFSAYIYGSFIFLTLFSIFSLFYVNLRLTSIHGNNYRVIHLKTKLRVPAIIVTTVIISIISNSGKKSFEQYKTSVTYPAFTCSGKTTKEEKGVVPKARYATLVFLSVVSYPVILVEKLIYELLDNETLKRNWVVGGITKKVIRSRISGEVSSMIGGPVSQFGYDISKIDCSEELGTLEFLALETLLGAWYSMRMFWDFPVLIIVILLAGFWNRVWIGY